MFGYIRPYKPELKMREYDSYRSMYCGLCHTMHSRYGLSARGMLSYDMCFIAMLACGATDCGIKTCHKRCMVSPIRKRSCVYENAGLDFAADCTVILYYWKLRDGAADEHGFKKLWYKIAAAMTRRKYKKASAYRPDFAAAVEKGLKELSRIEAERVSSIDRAADVFARIMQSVAAGIPDERVRRPYEQTLYHAGRWVYILDAWDDLDDDLKSGGYNAVAARYDVTTAEGRKTAKEAVRLTLGQSAQTAAAAAELVDLGRNDTVIRNILYMGLPCMADMVLEGMKEQRSSRHGSI